MPIVNGDQNPLLAAEVVVYVGLSVGDVPVPAEGPEMGLDADAEP